MVTSSEYYQKNKEKILEQTKKRYLNNKEHYLNYQKEYRRKNRQLVTDKQRQVRQSKLQSLILMLGNCCDICKQQYPSCVYDFHHNNPEEKKFTIGSYMGYKLETLKKEADKCTLLCANCHRIVHDTQ